MVVAVLVVHELHLAVNGKPVGMNVEKAHEYAYHQPLVVEVFVLDNFLDHHHLAVGRGNDHLFRIAVEITLRATEKVDDDGIHRAENDDERPEEHLAVNVDP